MSDTPFENKPATVEEIVGELRHDMDLLGLKVERLSEEGERVASFARGPEVDRLSEKLYQMDRRIDRLSESVYAMDQRIRHLSDVVYKISKNMGRSDEKPERPSQKVEKVEPVDSFWEEARAKRKAQQEEWDKKREQRREEERAQRKKWNIRSTEISIKHGTTGHDLLAPSLPDVLPEIVPCPPDEEPWVDIRGWHRHPKQRKKSLNIDGIVECGQYALFCDWRSELTSEDITEFVAKLAEAREYFPQYADYHLLGGVATLHIKPTLVQYATDKGILAFAVGEELMEIQNEAGFKPKRF